MQSPSFLLHLSIVLPHVKIEKTTAHVPGELIGHGCQGNTLVFRLIILAGITSRVNLAMSVGLSV